MTYLKRIKDEGPGKAVGTFATSPIERDNILHQAWDPITEGNHKHLMQDANTFVHKYVDSDCVFKSDQFDIGPLSV